MVPESVDTQVKPVEQNVFGKIQSSMGDMSILFALLALCALFALTSEYFLTARNLMNIGSYASIMGVMAAGLTVAMLLGGLDVSQYSLAAFSGMIMGMLVEKEFNPLVIIGIVLMVGLLAGSANAFIITVMRVNPIIATMGTQFIFRGGAFLLTNGRYIRIDNEFFNFIGNGKVLGVPFSLIIMAVIYVIIWYILKFTAYGRMVFAVGGNPVFSNLAGINVKKIKFISHVIAALTAVIGGIITVSQTAAAMPNHGAGNDMDGIAAVILGGISLSGGKGKVIGTLAGILILAVLLNGMTLLNVQSYWQQVIKGLVLIFAVFADTLRGGGTKI